MKNLNHYHHDCKLGIQIQINVVEKVVGELLLVKHIYDGAHRERNARKNENDRNEEQISILTGIVGFGHGSSDAEPTPDDK